jgi:hypothetical protein
VEDLAIANLAAHHSPLLARRGAGGEVKVYELKNAVRASIPKNRKNVRRVLYINLYKFLNINL